jgi:hypothetical protein
MKIKPSEDALMVLCDCESENDDGDPSMTECEPDCAGVENTDFVCPVCRRGIRVFMREK